MYGRPHMEGTLFMSIDRMCSKTREALEANDH